MDTDFELHIVTFFFAYFGNFWLLLFLVWFKRYKGTGLFATGPNFIHMLCLVFSITVHGNMK